METISLIFGLIVFILSVGFIKVARSFIKLVQYIIKAREDDNITKEEEAKIIELAKEFTGTLIKTIMKALTSKIDKNTKAKDVIDKLKIK